MDDFYSPVAEFYDLVPRAHAEGEAALRKILAEVDPSAGPVVDIGAGTGRTCRIVAEVLPTAKILASEPAPAMRAVLTHEVVTDDDLRARVTIVPEAAQSVVLPESISALILFGVLGHIGQEDRRALWDRVLPGSRPARRCWWNCCRSRVPRRCRRCGWPVSRSASWCTRGRSRPNRWAVTSSR